MQKGQRINDGGVKLSYLRNRGNHPRAAIIVSNKAAKKATARNILKRRLRAVLEAFVKTHPRASIDVVVAVLAPPRGDLIDAATQLLEKINA